MAHRSPVSLADFAAAIAYVGAPPAGSVPARAEVISMDLVRRRHAHQRVLELAEPWAFDERFTFTHFVGSATGGFLLARGQR